MIQSPKNNHDCKHMFYLVNLYQLMYLIGHELFLETVQKETHHSLLESAEIKQLENWCVSHCTFKH